MLNKSLLKGYWYQFNQLKYSLYCFMWYQKPVDIYDKFKRVYYYISQEEVWYASSYLSEFISVRDQTDDKSLTPLGTILLKFIMFWYLPTVLFTTPAHKATSLQKSFILVYRVSK